MADLKDQQSSFESVKARLAEIAEAVDDDSLSLDDALDLYEEAVALGLQASDLLETGINVPDDEQLLADADGSAQANAEGGLPEGTAAGSGADQPVPTRDQA